MKNTLGSVLIILAVSACALSPKAVVSDLSENTQRASEPISASSGIASQDPENSILPNDYKDLSSWLCHPSLEDDACDTDLRTTVVDPDGIASIESYEPTGSPRFDCFYVYPTVSEDVTPNSDMAANTQELFVIKQQFARFGSVCRLYAPLYRQETLRHLRGALAGDGYEAHPTLNYDDVKDAWNFYIREENNGRGVVLIGHSQGGGLITRLTEEQIVGSDSLDRIISVMPIGRTINADEDGKYPLPPCHSETDTGCLVAYVSFRGDREPPAGSRFGKTADDNRAALCVNPAQVAGGSGELKAYLARRSLSSGQEHSFGEGIVLETPFAAMPGLLTATCLSNSTHTWLAIEIHPDPKDVRADDIAGDLVLGGVLMDDWGLHLIDMNVAMGNLISLAKTQSEAWIEAKNPGSQRAVDE